MSKIITLEEAVAKVNDGDTIMVGGFLANGTPEGLVDGLVESGVKDLTLICNDTGFVDKGVGKMVVKKQFKKIIASHIGTNRETGNQLNSGETEVVLVPQGTLIEQVRAGGAGLGGVLTQTGLGTKVEEGKDKVTVDGKEYILEKPLRADVAIVYATKVDRMGNAVFKGSTHNFNIFMSTAADIVILGAEEIVEVGELGPHDIRIPGIFVDYIVKEEPLK